jgi:3',5'-cyclic AMP phosphodiesterase CpdA
MKRKITRREFIKGSGLALTASMVPLSLIEVACGKKSKKVDKFTFAFISDSHLTQIKGNSFVTNFDSGLDKAITELNFLSPKPDFVVYGGDLAQLGKREEIDHGLQKLSKISIPIRYVIGEHDYYLDLGKYWQEKVSKLHYSFDHKGVHFVVLNSILTHDTWIQKWKTPMERMLMMARLDNPQGSPFMVGNAQIDWLKKDLEKISADTPLVVLSHSPLYKIFKPWNFWTDDAEKVQAVLKKFVNVTVIHGHVHQVLYNQIGNITFNALMSTAWPWPYPDTYAQQKNAQPKLTVPMNRADPFHERDGTGWSHVAYSDSRPMHSFELWNNTPRTLIYDMKSGNPVDKKYTTGSPRSAPQKHY